MMGVAFDGVEQLPRRPPADFLQVIVERGDRHAAFGGGDLPIVVPEDRDVLGHSHIPAEQRFYASPRK